MHRPTQLFRFAILACLSLPCAAFANQQEVMLVSGQVLSPDKDVASTIDVDPDQSNVTSASAVQIRSDRNYSLLQPISQSTTPTKFSDKTAQFGTHSNDIAVTVSNFEEGLHDNYTLSVTNTGTTDYKSLLIVVKIPDNCKVHQILPKPIAVSGTNVIFSIPELTGRDKHKISIAATTPDGERVEFPAKVFADVSKSKATGISDVEWVRKTSPKAILAAHRRTPDSLPVDPFSPVISNRPTTETDDKPFLPLVIADQPQGIDNILPELNVVPTEVTQVDSLPTEATVRQVESIETEQATKTPSFFAGLTATIESPQSVKVGEITDYAISVQNNSGRKASKILIQLTIPDSLEVAILDRSAWFDEQTRKLTWEIDALANGQSELIQYKAVARDPGDLTQSVICGVSDQYAGESTATTTAVK